MATRRRTQPVIRFEVVPSKDSDLSSYNIEQFTGFEQRIAQGEHEGLIARWEYGRHILGFRRAGKKQLPNGLLDNVAATMGISRWEVSKRVTFAERYPTEDQVCDAVTHFPTWKQMVHEGLRRRRKPAGDTPEPDPAARWVAGIVKKLRDGAALDLTGVPPELLKELSDEIHACMTEIERLCGHKQAVGAA